MAAEEAPEWIEALEAALPGRDRRELEGWAVWLREIWSDSANTLDILRHMTPPEDFVSGLGHLLSHLELIAYDLPVVDDKMHGLYEAIDGEPHEARDYHVELIQDQIAGWWPGDEAEKAAEQIVDLRSTLRILSEAVRSFDLTAMKDASEETNRHELQDKLDATIRDATLLREHLGDD
jgi:hypothetical protein